MSIACQCPNCSRRFNAPDQYAGKAAKCPGCSKPIVIGAASPITATMPANRVPGASFQFGGASGRSGETATRATGSPKKFILIAGVAAAAVLLIGVAGAAYWLVGGGGTGSWKEYAPSGAGFTILMPAAPVQKDKTDPKITAATPIHEAIAQPAGSKVSYSVQYYDLGGRPINNYLYLSWMKHYALSGGGQLSREKEISLNPYTGKEIVIRLPDNQVLVRRVYLAEARVFWVTAQYPDAPMPPPEIQKFLDSFRITSVAKAPEEPAAVAMVEAPKSTRSEERTTKREEARPAPPPQPAPKQADPSPMQPKNTDPPPAQPKTDFPTSGDENTVVAAINQKRADKKVAQLVPNKQLFDFARQDAQNVAQQKPIQQHQAQGYDSTFRLNLSAPQGVTAQQLVDQLLAERIFRNQVLDSDVHGIGVGIASDNKGVSHYIIILGILGK